MIVKGIELMQMIADGKLKEGTRIKIEGVYFEYTDGEFFNNEFNQYLYNYLGYSLKGLVTDTFEILEDKTEEIEEIDTLYSMLDFTDIKYCKGEIDFNFKEIQDKINELVKAVNRLNKPIDTSKETNCMTD